MFSQHVQWTPLLLVGSIFACENTHRVALGLMFKLNNIHISLENLILDNFEARKKIIVISKEFKKCATKINSTCGQIHFYNLLEEFIQNGFNWEISLLVRQFSYFCLKCRYELLFM